MIKAKYMLSEFKQHQMNAKNTYIKISCFHSDGILICIMCLFLCLHFVCPFVCLYPGIFAWQSAFIKRLQAKVQEKSPHTEKHPWWKSPAANQIWGTVCVEYCLTEELVSFPLGFFLVANMPFMPNIYVTETEHWS